MKFSKVIKDACQEILANTTSRSSVSVRDLFWHIHNKGSDGE